MTLSCRASRWAMVLAFCVLPGTAAAAAAAAGNLRRGLHDDEPSITEEQEKPSPVIVSVWTKPVMDWDPATGLEEGPNIALLQTLKEVKMGMGDAMDFDMNAYIGSGDGVCKDLTDKEGNPLDSDAQKEVCDDCCANNHRYCELPPKDKRHWNLVKGRQLLEESLRRQCIWRMVHEPDEWKSTGKYFDYVKTLREIQCDQKGYRKLCIQNVLQTLRIGGNPLKQCLKDNGGVTDDNANIIFDEMIGKQQVFKMDEKTPMPAVYIGGVLQTNNTAAALLSAVCQVTPAELRPADVCDDIVDAVGADEDPEAGAKAEEELVEEIATELGETPEDVKGENASELEDKLEEEEIKEGQGDAEDMEKLAENLGTQDETELESGGDLSKVDEETIEVEEKALEKEEAKDANIEVEEPKSVQPIVEVWTTPLLDWDMASLTEDGPNLKLFEMLKSVVTSFGSDIDFRPQPYLFSQAEICTVDEKGNQLGDDDAAKCADDNCANNHRYCGFGPDDWKVTGKSMVEESVRRLCIWEDYGRGGAGSGATSYFSYLKKFHSHKCQQADDMNICVTEIYKFVNIEATNVDACMAGSGGLDVDGENSILAPLLKLQKATFFFHHLNPMNLPIILVDGQPLEGGADVSAADLVNAVCPKFTSDPKPALCQEGALAALIPGSEEEAATEEPPTESETPADDEETKATKSPAPSAAPSYSPSSAPSAAPSTPVSEGSEATEEPPVESEATETPPTEETETETTEMPPTEETETEATETPPTEATESEATETPPTEGAPDVLTPGTPQMPWGMSSAITTEPPPLDKAGEETFNTPVTLDKSKRGDDSNFDIKAFDSTLSNLGMLNTCGVDTNAVYNKVMSLAAGNMKQELEKIKIDLPMLMSQTCEKDMGVDVLHAMDQFHGCAKFNLQSLIENLPSAAFGVAMRCANAYSKITPEEEAKGFIPEDCIRAIENDSSLGRATFALYLYPDHACPCFETLGENIPECTADVWPIPINGALVKVQTCLVGQYCQSIDALCEKHLDTLNKCLPAHDTSNSKITCGECQAAFYDNVPKILSAAPLPDACVRMAEGSKFFGSHVMERFDTYRKKCGTNLELWEGHTPMAELKNFVMQGVKEIDYKSNQFIEGAVVGFAAGIVFTIAFIIVRWILICVCSCLSRWFCCCCKGKKKSQRPRAKDYATVETETDEIPEPEYRD